MTDRNAEDGRLSGRDLQDSQAGGESGEFDGTMARQQAQGIVGGGPSASDLSSAGGSSGTGGYGNSQNVANHQGQGESQPGFAGGGQAQQGDGRQSRGEAFDEQQGGGRGPDSISPGGDEAASDDLQLDQQAHQDRGQSEAEFNAETD